MVKVNGKPADLDGVTIAEALKKFGFDLGRVAVEVNGVLVPKSKHGEHILSDGDSVEAVSFVGGG
ncbi:MAG: sulfur carrier protein ThiS [Clostridia bacterium]|nr:sulfur carrier protein ThiS [Clostridia bacterium]